jgi:hypothetical protein
MRADEGELWGEEPIVNPPHPRQLYMRHHDMSAEIHQGTANEKKALETTRGVCLLRNGTSSIGRRRNLFRLQERILARIHQWCL